MVGTAIVSCIHMDFSGGLKTMMSGKGLGSLPPARVRNSGCFLDNKFFVIFGGNAKGALDDVFTYNSGMLLLHYTT